MTEMQDLRAPRPRSTCRSGAPFSPPLRMPGIPTFSSRPGRAARLAMLLLTAFLVVGCSVPHAPPPSSLRLEAIRHNDRGIREVARGDYEAALGEFAEALRLHAAIENEAGMIVALVNIARTSRARGETAAATAALARAAALTDVVPDLVAEVLFEQGKAALAADDLGSAGRLAAAALAAEKGERLAARYNLSALIRYRQGDPVGARRLAESALDYCQAPEHRSEEANAHRLLGEISLESGDGTAARVHFAAALALDKGLGRSARIAGDLRGLAEAALRQGERAEAIRFLQRAREVSANAGDTAAAGAAAARQVELSAEGDRQAALPPP